ncbi:hypothetical protein ACSFA2_00020 [Variovorax sp. LT2P21]|jgi:hypothetical protein|uniref:hypothetical protein n=1 Tax=Variovorax sp. LT2P21 TaxID=3443731 RepID=UPI003F464FD3
MPLTIQDLKDDFGRIEDDKAVHALIRKFGLTEDGVPQSDRDNLGTTGATIEGVKVRVAWRWYDPSGSFQNLPDIHKVRLELDGREWGERAYEDR